MRVTNAMLTGQAMRDLQGLRKQYAKAQSAVNGRALERPSEDPQRVVEAMDLSGAKLRLERAQRSGQDAREWLSISENSLNGILENLQSAREIAVQAGSPALGEGDSREALAQALLGIRDSLLREMNGAHRDQYLFSGWETGTKPFAMAADGSATYLAGNTGAITRDVAPGFSVTVNLTGDRVLAGGDFLKTLTDMAADVRAGNGAAATARLGELDKALGHLAVERSKLGVQYNQVERYETLAQDALLHIEQRLTDISGTDLETAVLKMTEAQNAYQAALASFAKSLPTSLLDYMMR